MSNRKKPVDPFKAFTFFIGFVVTLFLFLTQNPDYQEHRQKRNAPNTPAPAEVKRDSVVSVLSKDNCAPFAAKVYAAYQPDLLESRVWSIIPPSHRGPLSYNQVCDVFQHFVNWKYQSDPAGKDVIYPPDFAWDERFGDCDDRAVSLATALGALNCEVRLVGERFEEGWHLYPELLIRKQDLQSFNEYIADRYYLDYRWESAYRLDSDREYVWVNLDWSAKHPGGPYPGLGEGYFIYPRQGQCVPFSTTPQDRYAQPDRL